MTAHHPNDKVKIMASNVNNISNNNELVRDTIQRIDMEILVLSESIVMVDCYDHLGLKGRTTYNINPAPKKGTKGGTRAGVEMVIKIEIDHHMANITRVEDEADQNGLVQALTLKLKNGALVTGITIVRLPHQPS